MGAGGQTAVLFSRRLGDIARRAGRRAGSALAELVYQLGWRAGAAAFGVLAVGGAIMVAPASFDAALRWQVASAAAVDVTGSLPAGEPRPQWVAVQRPLQSFAIGLANFEGQRFSHEARRDAGSDRREEMIHAGRFEEPGAHLSLTFARGGGEPASFYVALSRRLADRGHSVERSAQAQALATKFGLIEAADVIIAGRDGSRPCLAFRHRAEGVDLTMHGVMCGTRARAADRQQLTCLIDRVQLIGAAEDRPLRALFSRAELNRMAQCATPQLQAAGRRASWLDADQAAPRLRRAGG
jgi:hypothetical protein